MIENMSAEKHFQTNITCSFLKDNKCSIYTIRPVACAGCYSTNQDICLHFHEKTSEYNNADTSKIETTQIKELSAKTKMEKLIVHVTLKQIQQDDNRYELNTSLVKLFNEPALLEKWQNIGEKIFD